MFLSFIPSINFLYNRSTLFYIMLVIIGTALFVGSLTAILIFTKKVKTWENFKEQNYISLDTDPIVSTKYNGDLLKTDADLY